MITPPKSAECYSQYANNEYLTILKKFVTLSVAQLLPWHRQKVPRRLVAFFDDSLQPQRAILAQIFVSP
jgi:hypothetical protein